MSSIVQTELLMHIGRLLVNRIVRILVGLDVHQQALSWKRELLDRIGMINNDLQFTMDRDSILRLLRFCRVSRTRKYLEMFRKHLATRTLTISYVGDKGNSDIDERYQDEFKSRAPNGVTEYYLRSRRLFCVVSKAGGSYCAHNIPRRAQFGPPVKWLVRYNV